VADISTRVKQYFGSLRFFINRHSCLLPGVEKDPGLMDSLESNCPAIKLQNLRTTRTLLTEHGMTMTSTL